jgi:hypothetical protein
MSGKKVFILMLFVIGIVTMLIFILKDNQETQEKIETLKSEVEPIFTEKTQPQNDEEIKSDEPLSLITALPCENYDKRAFAVMYSGDAGARPYFANLSLADFVAELPHRYIHNQPRIMGIFQCNLPEIVGPMRSGRVDHVSVATSFDAIYVPWGGSSIAKNLLKQHVVDHIDCNGEVYPSGGDGCFRRSGPMSMLEKASCSLPKLIKVAEEMEYRKDSEFRGFPHQKDLALEERPESAELDLASSNVKYSYDKETNSYKRYFSGSPDIDYENKTQYTPKNIILIFTSKEAWLVETNYTAMGLKDPWSNVDEQHQKNDSGQYPNMQLGDPWFDSKFEGEATFFLNGQKITGTWKRQKGEENPFEFYDQNGQKIKFVPGQIWMHVLEDYQDYEYKDGIS